MYPTNTEFQMTTGFKSDLLIGAKTACNIMGSDYDVGLRRLTMVTKILRDVRKIYKGSSNSCRILSCHNDMLQ